ncbi:hypothetical protein P4J17_19370 [Bacillus cereus]|uniref:hypothetical protein n=1 Tax=Bacillus thuringiensis TaxID=1428 RepID=UPI0018CD7202|nr:hypothetical protein [Bacillus thuringiensis]MEB9338035.1 hypothetical protein [Bacillus cereus]
MNYVLDYWNAIEAGKVIVSKRVYRQYKRLVDEINNSDKYIFDERKANKPIEFIERFCKHSKGEWVFLPIPPKRGNKDNNTLFFQGVFSC